MEIIIETIFGNYKCRSFTNVDPDETGIEISKDGNLIGSMIGVDLPNDDEMDKFIDDLGVWLGENE